MAAQGFPRRVPAVSAQSGRKRRSDLLEILGRIRRAFCRTHGLKRGKQIWENSNGGITTPIISNETMFDINNNRVVSATDTKTGKQIWETRLNTYDMIFDPLLINNQLLIPVANGDIIKINPYTGRIIETINLTSKIDVSPIAVEDKLIILSNATLRVFN